MKFKFKEQEYQVKAIEAIADLFEGQPRLNSVEHNLDIGTYSYFKPKTVEKWDLEKLSKVTVNAEPQTHLTFTDEGDALAYCNAPLTLDKNRLLKNIQDLQRKNDLEVSGDVDMRMGAPSFDIEMETGTGKTYVYTRAMLELNKRYGWNKYIIVVPSVPIREGVQKSLEITTEHFFVDCGYGKNINYFVYSSDNFTEIDSYAQSDDVSVMIINAQAFNSLEKNKYFQPQDNFGSRKPSEVVKNNRPIIIVDEPQKILGTEKKPSKTSEILKEHFGALFFLNFSATHIIKHNLIYCLDALDACNKKLVKKLQVSDVHISSATGRSCYIYVDDIIVDGNHDPRVKLEIEVARKEGAAARVMRIFDTGDSLYDASNQLPAYKGVTVGPVNAEDNFVEISGLSAPLYKGEYIGKTDDSILRRLEIRATIRHHLIREEQLFKAGIKCLSLFFIDKVVKFKDYSAEDLRGEYCKMFDEEYESVLKEQFALIEDEDYKKYLLGLDKEKIRDGYFSIDSKGHVIDSKEGRSGDGSDDESAYQRILINKEKLISFQEPLRFIFTHSALREGWDNPNIFQICTLKHPDDKNLTSRRQEIGRGLRICVNSEGDRMDCLVLGDSDFRRFNTLTIITEERFGKFYEDLQNEMAASANSRQIELTPAYFEGKTITVNGEEITITKKVAQKINAYLVNNEYVDENNHITPECRQAISDGTFVKPSGPELDPISDVIADIVKAAAEKRTKYEVGNGHAVTVKNRPNKNFDKPEFRCLWDAINHKYIYHVDFDSQVLIGRAIDEINKRLEVERLSYTITTVALKDNLKLEDVTTGHSYEVDKIHSHRGQLSNIGSEVKYDLIGEIAKNCSLTRKTIVSILSGINESKFSLYPGNPTEFISKISNIINDVKSVEIIKHIHYTIIDGEFDIDLFKEYHTDVDITKVTRVQKNVQDYIYNTSLIEVQFAQKLDQCDEIEVYAKLPDTRNSFYIPTPVGNYSPDWAIAFKKDGIKHLYFVAETKGDMNPNTRSAYENEKIECAKRAYTETTPNVKYDVVCSFDDLWQKLSHLRGSCGNH